MLPFAARRRGALGAVAIAFLAGVLAAAAIAPGLWAGLVTRTSNPTGLRPMTAASGLGEEERSAGTVAPNGLRWARLHPSGSPPPQNGAGIAYDAKDRYVVLFGGAGASASLGGTWKYQHGSWTNISSVPSPPAEAGASMVYDPAAGYVLLYAGGYGGNGSTWAFSGGSWRDLNVTGPPMRNVAYLGYDAADGYAVLFGGFVNHYPYHYLNDTWKFSHGKWSKIRTSTAPSPRADATEGGLSWDPNGGYLVLFGGDAGFGGAPYYGDTWTFLHGTWTLLHPASAPPARAYETMTYDPTLRGLVMYGGLINRTPVHDTWLFSNGNWTHLKLSPFPRGAMEPSSVFDPLRGKIILFGGSSATATYNQTWTLE